MASSWPSPPVWGAPGRDLPADHPAWDTGAWYLAQSILSLVTIVSPSRVIVGGRTCQAEGQHGKINEKLIEIAAAYCPPVLGGDCVAPPALGQQAGICEAFLRALTESLKPGFSLDGESFRR